MEPQIEKLLSDKIKHAEKTHVDWNSEWVWSRIEKPDNRRRYPFIYYAAAAAIIGIAIVFVYWRSNSYESNMMAHLDKLGSRIDKIIQFEKQDELAALECDEATQISEGNQQNKQLIIPPTRPKAAVVFSEPADVAPVDSTHKIADLLPQASTAMDTIQFAPRLAQREIKPIIGKIPRSSQRLDATRNLELTISLFGLQETSESSNTQAQHHTILSARINK